MRLVWCLLVCAGTMTPFALFAQSNEQLIAKILMAAPERLRADAAVIGWQDDGTRMTIRSSSNGVVCWDQSDDCLLYTSPSPRDGLLSRMPDSA